MRYRAGSLGAFDAAKVPPRSIAQDCQTKLLGQELEAFNGHCNVNSGANLREDVVVSRASLYHRYSFCAGMTADAEWLYFRFLISFGIAKDRLADRGVLVTHKTLGEGRRISQQNRHLTPRPCDKRQLSWHVRHRLAQSPPPAYHIQRIALTLASIAATSGPIKGPIRALEDSLFSS
ncbi:hypothetical protein Brsp05_04625 [Brucella sp. NBRC 12953]|uniref:hypothetical protein n=1 Tax=Brucella sp. NBRC 12953 TaxID=3075481 RepID=UPI0030B3B144